MADCPFKPRCPMFPAFSSKPMLKLFQLHYCESDYTECARYKLASNGTMPEPTLLPDGGELTPKGRVARPPIDAPERAPTADSQAPPAA